MSLSCPTCSAILPAHVVACPQCGAAVAGAPAVNPYAAPRADVASGRSGWAAGEGLWRAEKLLVMAQGAKLPPVCFRCGGREQTRLHRTLYWHPPGWYLMIVFPGLLIYAIVAMIIRKKAVIDLPLCEQHVRQRKVALAVGWIAALVGIGIGFGGMVSGRDDLIGLGCISGALVFLFGVIFGMVRARLALPTRITDTHVWLRGAAPSLLQKLPPAPGFN